VTLCFLLTTSLRIKYIGGLLTMFALLGATLAFLIKAGGGKNANEELEKKASLSSLTLPPAPFILLLILLGGLLVIAPEFVFLRDLFLNRMNTIFKFYYQAWLLWSLASAFGVAVLLEHFKIWKTTFLVVLAALALIFVSINQNDPTLRGLGWILAGVLFVIMAVVNRRQMGPFLFHTGLAIVLGTALIYPVLALASKTDNFQVPAFLGNLQAGRTSGDAHALAKAIGVWTLDGAVALEQIYPDDAAAARWLSTAPAGVVAEAVGDSYSDYARLSTYSGQPDVIGWPWHEVQWRGTSNEQISPIQNINCASVDGGPRKRSDDMRCLYETSSWQDASAILAGYNVQYVAVGTLERRAYHINDKKFQQYLTPVFQQGDVVIYKVP
jgi:hypothetical protein